MHVVDDLAVSAASIRSRMAVGCWPRHRHHAYNNKLPIETDDLCPATHDHNHPAYNLRCNYKQFSRCSIPWIEKNPRRLPPSPYPPPPPRGLLPREKRRGLHLKPRMGGHADADPAQSSKPISPPRLPLCPNNRPEGHLFSSVYIFFLFLS